MSGVVTISILIVDDDPFIVDSLFTILDTQNDMEVVGTALDGETAIEVYESCHPDIVLMDIRMPGIDGIASSRRIIANHPDARILFLTTFSDDEYIVQALRLGARGYLIKQEVATIAPAIRSVMTGQHVLGNEVIERLNTIGFTQTSKYSARTFMGKGTDLTERELAIVQLIADGADNKTIAHTLYISEGTVRNHISNILVKLDLKNRTQIAICYWKSQMRE